MYDYRDYLYQLFTVDEHVFFDREVNGRPVEIGCTRVGELAPVKRRTLPEFFTINPILDPKGSRVKSNIKTYRNWVFESDNLPLEAQLAAWQKISEKLPIIMLTYSGGKSYHAIVSLQDTCPFDPQSELGPVQYSALWTALAAFITAETSMVPDPSTKNPNRLSRLPTAFRHSTKHYQAPQPVDNARFVTFANLMEIAKPHFKAATLRKPVETEVTDLRTFEFTLASNEHKHLRQKLEWPRSWAASENMYPKLFQYTLWAIDSTGVDEPTFLSYLEKYTFPIIRETGYSRPLDLAVRKAFEWKSLTG